MTPQSVGVPDSRLVLGKHSGRHALALRCEQLGHKFERRELDEIYRKFVILADRIKHVQDSHLIELIQEAQRTSDLIASAATNATNPKKIGPHSTTTAHFPLAAAAAVGHESSALFQMSSNHGQASIPLGDIPLGERRGEQEDYLWGV
jgi:hypothetical protein